MSGSFRNFSSLPAEIRSMIWEYSLPEPRVYEVLDAPSAKQKTPAQKGLMFANVHTEPPPAVAAVCREARYYVLRDYKPLTLGGTTKFVDLSRDILLLEPYLLIKRLHRTLHFMGQIPLIRDKISRLALGTSYGVYTGICHPVLSWKVSKNNMGKLLLALAGFPRLRTLIFVVHQEFQFDFDFRCAPPPALLLPQITPPPPPGSIAAAAATAAAAAAASTAGHHGHHHHHHTHHTHTHNHTHTHTHTTHTSLLQPIYEPRTQLVHQAYRFKFDIEANINHRPLRRPHLNELLYYPLDDGAGEDSKEDERDLWDLPGLLLGEGSGAAGAGAEDEEGWCDPWPTNDDWRRFKRRFQRAILVALEMGFVDRGVVGRGRLPGIKGASLLWRYGRGCGE
ncbi:uncharacterized protein E0L32_003544 [Thyridium curvatum]|uniref:2EXR domain-containing protein n=1 Tax=Thyridium curvatum TaxID=1093900 RepID=A0A507B3Z9_9PEZI|nr:uncharacterized protein E0L32_003544 [Thyridium curvatum]TPX16982.1 hypothetical protein E0L32_003544 [Thyridium curvatum]